LEEWAGQASAVQASGRPKEVARGGQADLLEQAKQNLHLQVGRTARDSDVLMI